MTRRQRAQVVELLRCAADLIATDERNRGSALSQSLMYLDSEVSWHVAQSVVRDSIYDWPHTCFGGSNYEFALLEAALRVERMEWP